MNDIHDIVKQYTIGDGEHIVVDYNKSYQSYLIDASTGKKYLDCSSQYASQPLGWNHPVLKQCFEYDKSLLVHKIANSDFYTDVYAKFLQTFSTLTPDFDYHFFVEGGSLAVENAIKAAFDWKAQKLGLTETEANEMDIIHFKQAFHGRSGYCLSLTNTVANKIALFPKFNWTRVTNPKIHFPMNESEVAKLETESLEQILQALQGHHKVAAILLETIQGEGGDNHFRPEYFKALRQIADDHDTLLILDEVQTGVGLTGKMWAYKHYGIIPDIIAFGKKTQVCGIAATKRLDEVPSNVFKVSSRINSTWGGNLVDMKRFTCIAQIIQQEDLVSNAAIVGKYFLECLQELTHISNVRGKGLLLAFDLDTPKLRDDMLYKLRQTMSILPCGEKSIRIRPHLTFNRNNVDEAIDYISKAAS